MRLQNLLLFLLLVFLWGSNWSVAKRGMNFVPPATFVMQRFIISSIALSPIFVLLRKKIPRDSDTLKNLVLLSLINVSQNTATMIGLVEESSSIGAMLTYTQPLFVFCLAIPFLKEKVAMIKLIGVITGFLGVVLLFLGKISYFTFSFTLLMVLGAFLWAVAIVYYKKYLSHVDPFVTNFFQMTIGTFPLAVLSITTNSFVLPKEVAYLWIILYSSVGALFIGGTIWLFLLKEEEATVLSGSSFIIPVFALLFGWQLLGEKIQTESILGSALILGGVYLVNLRNQNRKN